MPDGLDFLHQRYFYSGVTRPGPGVSEFMAVDHVDDVQFIRFDGDQGRGRAGSGTTRDRNTVAHWKDPYQHYHYYLDRDTQGTKVMAQTFRWNLQNIPDYYNQSKEGSHSLQPMYGCQLREDIATGYGFGHYGYDGRDYIALDRATRSWTAADARALNTKRQREADGTIAERAKAYLEGECIEWLRRYLRFAGPSLTREGSARSTTSALHQPSHDKARCGQGMCLLHRHSFIQSYLLSAYRVEDTVLLCCRVELSRVLRMLGPSWGGLSGDRTPVLTPVSPTDPPSVRVTRHLGPEGDEVTLRWRAFGFYPADIRFKWEREGEDMSQKMEYMDTRLRGDGKFQKWASLRVPQEEEQKYVCVVDHVGLAPPFAVRWGKGQKFRGAESSRGFRVFEVQAEAGGPAILHEEGSRAPEATVGGAGGRGLTPGVIFALFFQFQVHPHPSGSSWGLSSLFSSSPRPWSGSSSGGRGEQESGSGKGWKSGGSV
ncbi:BOLA class I histocompatibility antigen, alpha chain BL3-7-like [Ornithorhynchus anatinus]|uniref:BOLA class I histocompatibility antigen, alpha chain BL3-7-like n=1 Tax=Ornithorhynchus anatinus TaxID=9258 RepID=UPI0019D42D6B|nr:BOLA class I histocompatibility antigen, alpha chain BL3-7-like [Ornithorhynchus anatinus]